MLLIATLIISIDGKPILFMQKRLGFRKRLFLIMKFRTLKENKVTRTGKWLRATGLDELPQLLNIVRGEMNVVGPRPLTDIDCERFKYNTREHLRRWVVKPGLTGLSQVCGAKSAHGSWEIDTQYIKTRTVGMDLVLVGITLLMNAGGKRIIRGFLQSSSVSVVRKYAAHFGLNARVQ